MARRSVMYSAGGRMKMSGRGRVAGKASVYNPDSPVFGGSKRSHAQVVNS